MCNCSSELRIEEEEEEGGIRHVQNWRRLISERAERKYMQPHSHTCSTIIKGQPDESAIYSQLYFHHQFFFFFIHKVFRRIANESEHAHTAQR